MKQLYKNIFLTALLSCSFFSSSFSTNAIENFFVKIGLTDISKNDDRVIGLKIAGGIGVLLGAYLTKKGIDVVTAKSKTLSEYHPVRYFFDTCSGIVYRVTGAGVTVIGIGTMLAGGAAMIFGKDVITEFEVQKAQSRYGN